MHTSKNFCSEDSDSKLEHINVKAEKKKKELILLDTLPDCILLDQKNSYAPDKKNYSDFIGHYVQQ